MHYRAVEVGYLHELYYIADATLTARLDHDVTEAHDQEADPEWRSEEWIFEDRKLHT